MSWSATDFTNLENAVKTFDRQTADKLCQQLSEHITESADLFPEEDALAILNLLRRKRMFAQMQRVADALIQSGQGAYQIRRQYAQSLIDQGTITAAIRELDALITATANDSSPKAAKENVEARGLKGRAYKQLYINAKDRTSERVMGHLREAVRWYSDVYTSAPEKNLWHGINVVALLMLARRDGVALEGFPNPEEIARNILKVIDDKDKEGKAEQWDFGTAVEACVALGNPADAEVWLGKYVKAQYEDPNQYADAFEIASTLRQFEEVWQLQITSAMGKRILPVLRAELLKREGGEVKLSLQDLQPENSDPAPDKSRFEAVFGGAAFDSYQSLVVGMARARAVGRVQRTKAAQGTGTGFLVRGTDLHESYGKDFVLLTNAHVISNDPAVRQTYRSLDPSEAYVIFEALGPTEYKVTELLWTSPPYELDATVVRLNKQVPKSDLYPLAEVLPVINTEARVYVIGHPLGGNLSYSFQDNLLLDQQLPPGFLHYRTPTQPGSSGSPVFNRDWNLIGLHHKGGTLQKLNKQPGTYEANEGIWIRSIIEAIAKSLENNSSKTPKKESTKKSSTKAAKKSQKSAKKKAKGK